MTDGEPIDIEALLACIPDSTSEGLSRDEIRELYAKQRPSFNDDDFDAALEGLAGGQVRTTTRRLWGVKVPLYRRA
jgi:predicted proteasome-type protease